MAGFIEGLTWLNEPPDWRWEGDVLRARSGDRTDFWRGTYYGFHRDDGHFLWCSRTGDFTATATFDGQFETLYDQVGLMVRADAERWMKCGIEFTDGAKHLSVVVTHGASDWSVQRLEEGCGPVTMRVTRLRDALFVQFRSGQGPWVMARLAWFPADIRDVAIGLAFCSPQRAGFQATYSAFAIGDPVGIDGH